jgi:hypothetical protein
LISTVLIPSAAPPPISDVIESPTITVCRRDTPDTAPAHKYLRREQERRGEKKRGEQRREEERRKDTLGSELDYRVRT